jgi:hypothetical protein
MGLWKRPGREPAGDDGAERPPSPFENTIGVTQSQILSVSPNAQEKTIGVTQSQILSVSPNASNTEPPTPPPPSRPVEKSLWGGDVLASDEFAPDAQRSA